MRRLVARALRMEIAAVELGGTNAAVALQSRKHTRIGPPSPNAEEFSADAEQLNGLAAQPFQAVDAGQLVAERLRLVLIDEDQDLARHCLGLHLALRQPLYATRQRGQVLSAFRNGLRVREQRRQVGTMAMPMGWFSIWRVALRPRRRLLLPILFLVNILALRNRTQFLRADQPTGVPLSRCDELIAALLE